MRKVISLVLTVLMVAALVGCNVAPNVPNATPYATNGASDYNTGNTYGKEFNGYDNYTANPNGVTGIPGLNDGLNTENNGGDRDSISDTDKNLLPGV